MKSLKQRNTFRVFWTIILGLYITSSLNPLLAAEKVAKVILMRGKIMAKNAENKVFKVNKGMWLKEGTTIQSASRSFAKLLFIDKSQISLGPKSAMKITTFPKKKAGIISLLKGQIRSKVSKNYMEMTDKNRSKLFIKTKTAAMGVRGTDFQVTFRPENNMTALITFEGAVAMAKLSENIANVRLDQDRLESIVSSDKAVIVRKGQFSGASPKKDRVNNPVKISPVQLKALEKSTPLSVEVNKAPRKEVKKFRNPIPPGVDAKSFVNTDGQIDKEFGKAVGDTKVIVKIDDNANTVAQGNIPPEGFVDSKTGEFAPTSGGVIDLETGIYVPPPPGSVFDANTGTYVLPATYGSIDENGNYNEPVIDGKVYELTPDGKFVVDEVASKEFKKELAATNKRAPASLNNENEAIIGNQQAPLIHEPPKLDQIDSWNVAGGNNGLIGPDNIDGPVIPPELVITINKNNEDRDNLLLGSDFNTIPEGVTLLKINVITK